MVQGFYLAPSTFLSCLHDTGLEPTHISVDFAPIDGISVHRFVRDCTNSHLKVHECCRHLLFLFCRFVKFSRGERPVGSQHPFRLGIDPIYPITG